MNSEIVSIPSPRFADLKVSSYDVQKAFIGTFHGIESLVDGQISKIKEKRLRVTVRTTCLMNVRNKAHGAKGIILVGGLGSSPYLYEYLKGKYRGKKIDVLQSNGIRP